MTAALVLLIASSGGAGAPPSQIPTELRPFRLGPSRAAAVRRVVTLAPSLTELVIALGAQDRLVGVSRFDEAAEVKTLPRVGGFIDPNPEAVLAAKPDLMLVQPAPGNRRPVEKLAELGVPVLAVPLHSVDDVLRGVRAVAEALYIADKGEALARSMESRRSMVRSRATGLPRPRVLMVFGWEPLVVAGPGSFADELLSDAGGANVVALGGAPFQTCDIERAMARAPEVVLDCADVGAPSRKRLLALPGLRGARVVKLGTAILRPGPRLLDALEEVFRALHPADGGR